MHGFLNVDKPHGITSMDVIRCIKRLTKQRKVGHGGTLDPYATGVLPVCFGQATRLMDYLIAGRKVYRAVLELGVTTDTYDAAGKVTDRNGFSSVSEDNFQTMLLSFIGTIHQIPPMYSALKKDGRRLYDLARSGIEVQREPRRVHVFSADVVEWKPPYVTVIVECGRGVYIRSLAHDIGESLGCGAHLKELVRLRSGSFYVNDAIPLSELEENFAQGDLKDVLYPVDFPLQQLRALIVGSKIEELVTHGRAIVHSFCIPPSRPQEESRVYTKDGRFVAVLTFDASLTQWRPIKVFSSGALGAEQR